jgi:tetratricopeptide (TPR) repeat protein
VDSQDDIEKLRVNLNEKYHYRGFLRADGSWDDDVYKDEQATRLLQNYAASRVRLAMALHARGRDGEARVELDKLRRWAHYFDGVDVALGMAYMEIGQREESVRYYEDVLKSAPANAAVWGALGRVRSLQGDTALAVSSLKRSIELAPGRDFTPYLDLINIYRLGGDSQTVIALLESWLKYHPEDTRVAQYLKSIRESS